MEYSYDKDLIKNSLDTNQMVDILSTLGGEPTTKGDVILCRTICHCGNSHKLYYYENTKLFKCYTDCGGEAFDIFELVRKVKAREEDKDYSLPRAIDYTASYFGFMPNVSVDDTDTIEDWKVLDKYDRIKDINRDKKEIELKEYDGSFLKNLPRPRIQPWEQDGISKQAMDDFGICFEPSSQCIVIPHYDVEGRLVGIRQRTLSEENAKKYGKYMPLKMGKQMYNHPLSFNLYGLYQNQENIVNLKRAIVFESEKSVLQLETMLGREQNIGVAVCGSSFIAYQCQLLIDLGVKEIIVALDRQFKELGDDEHKKLVKNLKGIHKKYGQYVTISYIFDKEMITPYKASPSDCGKEIFMKLYRERVNLY